MKEKRDIRLSRLLRELLNKEAPPQFQSVEALAEGLGTYGDIIAHEVLKAACMGKEWAILMIRDGTEGKPGQAVKDDTNDRSTEEALDDVTRRRLNDLAGANSGAAAAPVNHDPEPAPENPKPDEDGTGTGDGTTGAARRLLDLPRDGDCDSEDGAG